MFTTAVDCCTFLLRLAALDGLAPSRTLGATAAALEIAALLSWASVGLNALVPHGSASVLALRSFVADPVILCNRVCDAFPMHRPPMRAAALNGGASRISIATSSCRLFALASTTALAWSLLAIEAATLSAAIRLSACHCKLRLVVTVGYNILIRLLCRGAGRIPRRVIGNECVGPDGLCAE